MALNSLGTDFVNEVISQQSGGTAEMTWTVDNIQNVSAPPGPDTILFSSGSFTSGLPAQSSVPEPTSIVLLSLALFALVSRKK